MHARRRFRCPGGRHRDVTLRLPHRHCEVPEDVRHALGPALIARGRIADAGARKLAVLLHDLRGVGLEDGIRVIADELLKVRDAIGRARSVEHRPRTRSGWLEAGEERMRPVAGEIGNVLRSTVGRQRGGRRPPCGQRRTVPRDIHDRPAMAGGGLGGSKRLVAAAYGIAAKMYVGPTQTRRGVKARRVLAGCQRAYWDRTSTSSQVERISGLGTRARVEDEPR